MAINDKHIEVIVRRMLRKVRIEGIAPDELVPRGRVVPGDHARPHRGRDDDWMPKARALAAMFGTDEEEELPTLPPEELSLEDLDDDEDEEGAEELGDIADAEPTEAELKEPAE